MRPIVATFLIAIIVVGCRKTGEVKPGSSTLATTSANNTLKTTNDPALKLSHDDSVHLAAFKVNPQTVNTNVSGTNLIMQYNENINLLFTEEGYQNTSAVHLLEDFKNTLLAGFEYTTVAEGGNTTLNWVDDNLNNVVLKTVSDTIINKQKMVKINIHRTFTFFRIYDSNQSAVNEQALLVKKADDTISFSSYCYYNQKNYPTSSIGAKVVYSK